MKQYSRIPYRHLRLAMIPSLMLIVTLLTTGCTTSEQHEVELLKYPYPYKAGLAIASDIDGTESMDEFYAIQDYLCGDSQTIYGPGLGLEIGNTFWFYNQYVQLLSQPGNEALALDSLFSGTPDKGISVFRGTSDTLTDYAPEIFALIEAGYIDCLHSYGHFTEGGFKREFAERAVTLFDTLGLQVGVFISHGGPENQNNLGLLETFHGDNPTDPEYHADLTDSLGVRFI